MSAGLHVLFYRQVGNRPPAQREWHCARHDHEQEDIATLICGQPELDVESRGEHQHAEPEPVEGVQEHLVSDEFVEEEEVAPAPMQRPEDRGSQDDPGTDLPDDAR
jgi:hypothetical protein